MPPSTLIGSGQGEWTAKDRLLVVAHHLYERSLCTGCSGPIGEWDTEQDYAVEEHVCPRCAAREQHARDESEPRPGVKLAVVKETAEHEGPDEFAPVFD